jgi:hypothetical protein
MDDVVPAVLDHAAGLRVRDERLVGVEDRERGVVADLADVEREVVAVVGSWRALDAGRGCGGGHGLPPKEKSGFTSLVIASATSCSRKKASSVAGRGTLRRAKQ